MRSILSLAVVAFTLGALAKPVSVAKKVPGKAFDRFVVVWCENTDYDKAVGDPNFAWLAEKSLTLSNYHAVTHPSQPNYAASIGGDYFGMNHDDTVDFPANISTVIDLLEDKGISWAEYQEDMPSAGFLGNYPNPDTGADMYVRKHNPAAQYLANTDAPSRMLHTKPLTSFFTDLKKNALPQWMFITPNMTSDGHDTSVTVAGTWVRNFLEPLLDDPHFMDNTLVLVTFDENHTYTAQNKVLAMLCGDALPKGMVGKTDEHFYNHYSEAATVEANWDLHTLGRFDAAANVFTPVAHKTGDKVRQWKAVDGHVPLDQMFFNLSYAGIQNHGSDNVPIPAPNVNLVHHGRAVLPAIVSQWSTAQTFSPIYQNELETYDGLHPPPGYEPTKKDH